MALRRRRLLLSGISFAGDWPRAALVGVFDLAQGLLLVYSAHRFTTLWRWARRRGRSVVPERAPPVWPSVTVQLPLYNERLVAGRLIDSVAALDYPAHLLQIQVLDDSTDETSERAAAAAARYRARGIDIEVLHRKARSGFKAGALAAGLESARGELIAIFDADFVPGPDFVRRIVPYFSDPSVGMVQARWAHLNRGRSFLTRAQAVMLDAHFFLEHEARMRSRLFFNFNGTAGIWRRTCIEAAGGWAHDTLTEDLDLSYRAQLQGWRFVSLPQIEAPAELPVDVLALKSQQRRWAEGSIQTAMKLLPAMLRSQLPLGVKQEAIFHLTGNVTYPLLLLAGLLLLPVATASASVAPRLAAAINVALILTGVVPVCAFLAFGQAASGVRGWRMLRGLAAALVVGAGLTWNNTCAVLQGLRRRVGDWERTPKTGDGGPRSDLEPYRSAGSLKGLTEILLAAYFAWMAWLAWRGNHPGSIPFLSLLLFGLGYVGTQSLRESIATPRPRGLGPGRLHLHAQSEGDPVHVVEVGHDLVGVHESAVSPKLAWGAEREWLRRPCRPCVNLASQRAPPASRAICGAEAADRRSFLCVRESRHLRLPESLPAFPLASRCR